MTTIWKYALAPAGFPSELTLPVGARVLTAQIQSGVITLWVLLDTTRQPEARRFRVTGTGWDLPSGLEYVATVQDGPLVWHVFEEPLIEASA